MKKFLSLLLVLAVVCVLPFGVGAATSYKDVLGATSGSLKKTDNADKTTTYDYTFYIQILEGTLVHDTAVDVKFTYPKEAKSFKCGQVDGFTVATGDTTETTTVCKYTPTTDQGVNEKLAIGKFTMVLATDYNGDCTVTYEFQDNTGKINPKTGSSVSYIIVGSGILAAAAAFVISKKKSKLYNV